jgi:hypothetical protein
MFVILIATSISAPFATSGATEISIENFGFSEFACAASEWPDRAGSKSANARVLMNFIVVPPPGVHHFELPICS